jgi:hypothetical protein
MYKILTCVVKSSNDLKELEKFINEKDKKGYVFIQIIEKYQPPYPGINIVKNETIERTKFIILFKK